MGNKEYAVVIEVSEQVTEDKWLLNRKVLKVTENTTIKDIHEWRDNFLLGSLFDVRIHELSELPKS